MKKTIIFTIIVFLFYTNKSFCQIVNIDDVEIIPSQPLPHENITIQATGTLTQEEKGTFYFFSCLHLAYMI